MFAVAYSVDIVELSDKKGHLVGEESSVVFYADDVPMATRRLKEFTILMELNNSNNSFSAVLTEGSSY